MYCAGLVGETCKGSSFNKRARDCNTEGIVSSES